MKIPLNPDEKDPIWVLFGIVIKLIDSRSFQQELARNGLKKINIHQTMLKLILLSIFFKLDLSYVYNQTLYNNKLLKFLNINNLPSLKEIREIYSRHSEDKYLELTLKTLNKLQFKKIRNIKTIIIDSTPITLDLKFNGKFLSKQILFEKDYGRAYSTGTKHYAGFQMTIAIEHETCKPLALLIHRGSPHDSKIFDEILHELKRRKILKKGQLILCDRGFQSLQNYLIGINKYQIIPLLFPKKKPSLITLIERIQNPLNYFTEKEYKNPIYNYLKQKLFQLLPKWKDYRRQRWKIEETFKFLKQELKMKNIHAYTKRSVYKHVYLNVLLIGIMISKGYKKIEEISNLVEFT